jgi:CubicO group peptidase (beta-lactamase class C family)
MTGCISAVDAAATAEIKAGFSGAVLIAKGDKVWLDKSYGAAAATPGADGHPAFWLASDSKQFTATAILRLQDAGLLHVTDTLSRFFADVPLDKQSITLHQLLTHTSGLPSEYKAEGIVERDRAVSAILGLKLIAPPGARYAYSNDGFVLLAAVVDQLSAGGFDAVMADLFSRAGMRQSGVWGREAPEAHIAALADPGRGRRQRATIYLDGHSVGNWGYRGPGGAYATAGDVHRWIQAVRGGKILSEGALRALLGRHVLVKEDATGQSFGGYGWGIRVEGGADVSYGHVGDDDWLGHNAVVRFAPDGLVVVVLSNAGDVDGAGWSTRVNRTIRRIMDAPR